MSAVKYDYKEKIKELKNMDKKCPLNDKQISRLWAIFFNECFNNILIEYIKI